MTWQPETVHTELDAALRDLGTVERVVLERHWLAMSRQAVDHGRPRVAHTFHVLAVAAAAEGDRRTTVLDATARDVDGVEPGAIVEDVDALLEQLSGWTVERDDGDGDGEASTP